MKKLVVSLVQGALILTSSASAAEKVPVVSFSPLLTEIAQQVGGDAVNVVGLVKPGVDPHGYEPKPGDLKAVAEAAVVLVSGKNLERYLGKLSSSAGGGAVLVEVGAQIPSLQMPPGAGEVAGNDAGSGVDPHWWQSVPNVERATKIVRDALIAANPGAEAEFTENAATYLAKLATLDGWIKSEVARVPRDQRELVTSHDAFQYFARDYGFKIHAIEGVSPDQEPSTKQVNALIDTIKNEGVKAIFLEDTLNPKVSTEIMRETGAKIGGTLYADGPGVGAETYEKMQRHNVTAIVEALK